MLTKTKIAFAAALILGTASAALAGDSGENNQGGFVMPGSMVGVNPAYHPDTFGNAAKTGTAGYAYGYVASPNGKVVKAGKISKVGNAYGYAASPTQQEDVSQHRLYLHDRQWEE